MKGPFKSRMGSARKKNSAKFHTLYIFILQLIFRGCTLIFEGCNFSSFSTDFTGCTIVQGFVSSKCLVGRHVCPRPSSRAPEIPKVFTKKRKKNTATYGNSTMYLKPIVNVGLSGKMTSELQEGSGSMGDGIVIKTGSKKLMMAPDYTPKFFLDKVLKIAAHA